MRLALVALPVALVAALPRTRPPPPLFTLPTVPRIELEVARDHVLVTEDVNLGRGEWRGGDVELYVAFGAPGAPRAFDARLFAAGDGGHDPPPDAASEPTGIERAVRRPPAAFLLLGSQTMAGVVLRIHEASFRRAVAATGIARLRLRSLSDLSEQDAEGAREVVVRLGVREGPPLALGRLDVYSPEPDDWMAGADAHLCGPEADPYPLAVSVQPKSVRPTLPLAPVAPVLSTRHSTDDLCFRLWTR